MKQIEFPPVVRRWLSLLRDPEFLPGPGVKMRQLIAGEWCWSPLGVLAEAGAREGLTVAIHDGGPQVAYFGDGEQRFTFPPSKVIAAAKLASTSGKFRLTLPDDTETKYLSVWKLGGVGLSFPQIAEVIEANPPGLFLPSIEEHGTRIGSGGVYDLPEELIAKLKTLRC